MMLMEKFILEKAFSACTQSGITSFPFEPPIFFIKSVPKGWYCDNDLRY